MAIPTNDRALLVTQTANHLRLVQADDDPPDVQKGFLADELAKTLATVNPEERQAFLHDLLGQFPTWDTQEGTPPPPPPPPPPGVDALVEKLSALAQESPERQEEIKRKLRAAGVAGGQTGGDSASELTQMLQDFATHLEHLWEAWAALSPRVAASRGGDLGKDIENLRRGRGAAANVHKDLDRLQRLIVGTTDAMGALGKLFEPFLASKELTPQAIRDLVDAEKGAGLLGNVKAACWTRYETQYNKGRPALAREFQAKAAEVVERYFARRPDR